MVASMLACVALSPQIQVSSPVTPSLIGDIPSVGLGSAACAQMSPIVGGAATCGPGPGGAWPGSSATHTNVTESSAPLARSNVKTFHHQPHGGGVGTPGTGHSPDSPGFCDGA